MTHDIMTPLLGSRDQTAGRVEIFVPGKDANSEGGALVLSAHVVGITCNSPVEFVTNQFCNGARIARVD